MLMGKILQTKPETIIYNPHHDYVYHMKTVGQICCPLEMKSSKNVNIDIKAKTEIRQSEQAFYCILFPFKM